MLSPDERFVTVRDFMRRSSLGKTTVYKFIKDGELPKPIRISANRVAFPASVVEAWMASKIGEAA